MPTELRQGFAPGRPDAHGVEDLTSWNWIQWPAMVATVAGAWLTASRAPRRRALGFWVFLASNVMWGIWGWVASAPATLVLQVFLAGLNFRGAGKNESHADSERSSAPSDAE